VVLEVLSHRPEGARRATTLIKAKYKVGDGERVKVSNLCQLKKDNPNPEPPSSPPNQEPPPLQTAAAPIDSTNVAAAGSPPSNNNNTDTSNAPGTTQTVTTHLSASTASTGASQVPTVTCHGLEWFSADTTLPTNGPFTQKTWKLTCQYTAKEFTPMCDEGKDITAMEFFMAVFPAKQLSLMVEETNKNLVKDGKAKTTKGEVLKWLGVLLLITRFEFGDRSNLWNTQSRCKYIPCPNFGDRTGMTRDVGRS
jgi:Transposase IS4